MNETDEKRTDKSGNNSRERTKRRRRGKSAKRRIKDKARHDRKKNLQMITVFGALLEF